MKKLLSLLLAAVLLLGVVPAAGASALQFSLEQEDPAEYYTIGAEENTFAGLCERMCHSLDLKEHPLPQVDTEGGEYDSGDHEIVCILKDDSETYEYIGYVCTKKDVVKYIVWRWVGFHKDGSMIGMDSYFDEDGKYLGNIQHDYTAGTSTSSSRCPYFIPGEPINKE